MLRYLVLQFFRRIGLFFWRWYVVGSRTFWARVIEEASAIDRFFAIKVTAKLWLQPLYGDYSPVGRLLGPFFRTWRILLGFATYLAFFSAAFLVWLAWISLPILLIVRAVIG